MKYTGKDSIKAVYDLADEIDLSEGLTAYRQYRKTMIELSDLYNVPLKSVVGAFCALSPNNDYIKNLRSAVTILWGYSQGIDVERLTTSTYKACQRRAYRFCQGEDFLNVTRPKSKKTRSFYTNILYPTWFNPVTVDGHMISIWHGIRMTMKDAVRLNYKYDEIADGLREVAADIGILPNQLQATLWFTWKRVHRIVYNPQLSFEEGNHWRSYVRATDVLPYPLKPICHASVTEEPEIKEVQIPLELDHDAENYNARESGNTGKHEGDTRQERQGASSA